MYWEECSPLPLGFREWTQCVLVNDQLCVGIEYSVYLASPDLKSWKMMNTRTHDFALASYNSQILTIGGLDSACGREITGESWIIDIQNRKCVSSPVPPMLTKRHSASAINIESANCLVVAGGANDKEVIDSVEVLLKGMWTCVQRLITPEFGLRAALHDGSLYFTGNVLSNVYHCKVEELLQACGDPQSEHKHPSTLWDSFCSFLLHKSPVSFGKHLAVIGVEDISPVTEIHAFSSTAMSWVHVADAPNGMINRASIVIPTGELIVMGKAMSSVYRGRLKSESCQMEFTDYVFLLLNVITAVTISTISPRP